MFERRLKLFLAILVTLTFVLVIRAAQVQVVQKDDWRLKATETMKRSKLIETTRGRLLDIKGRPLAEDKPCIDVCIDFRAMYRPSDPEGIAKRKRWIDEVAVSRLRSRLRDEYKNASKAKKKELLTAEVERVEADINAMWGRLAEVSGRSLAQVEEARNEIVKKVDMRRRYVWERNYKLAMKKYEERDPAPAWRRWLLDETSEEPDKEEFAKLTVAEEISAHPILRAVNNDVQNELRKRVEDYPGLVLRAGVQRFYPDDTGVVACHLIGQLARVTREDIKSDANAGKDELRQYYPNDSVGRTGLEMLAEPLLRGSRGRIETIDGGENEVGRVEYQPGKDVHTTIDIELQRDVLNFFRDAEVVNEVTKQFDRLPMHGGAVVIDIPTGEVRALASFPTYDLSRFDDDYSKLVDDDLNFPLLNRATQVARTPGSTVKPLVGLAAIAEGKCTIHQGIECNGFMQVDGRNMPNGRCWTQSLFGHLASQHHQIPYNDAHVGTFGNPNGFLTFSDAVQRSCNVYFETLGDRLKQDKLSEWYRKFGLGQRTGLGIPESTGSLPDSFKGPAHEARFATWIAAIGQGQTTATPVQMANVAATIARGGVWMRPRLIPDAEGINPPEGTREREDLKLSSESIAAAKDGMKRVVNTPAGSAFKIVRRDDIIIAGKTGTAEEGSRLLVQVRDANGNKVFDIPTEEEERAASAAGKKLTPKRMMRVVRPSSPINPNPEAPWYRGWGEDGTKRNHSWFIGFAPADNPKIAFAVMMEYGGSGGQGAGRICRRMVESLIKYGYLPRDPNAGPVAQPANFVEPAMGEEHMVAD